MLNPDPVVDAIVEVLQSIPDLAAAMTVDGESRIRAFHYLPGQEESLTQAVHDLQAPSMLVAWEGTQGGNFDGTSCFKHRFAIYLRAANAAEVQYPLGYARLWWIVCNQLPTGSTVNIRYLVIYPGLDIMDNPSIEHMLDDDGQDLFKIAFVIPEIGDN